MATLTRAPRLHGRGALDLPNPVEDRRVDFMGQRAAETARWSGTRSRLPSRRNARSESEARSELVEAHQSISWNTRLSTTLPQTFTRFIDEVYNSRRLHLGSAQGRCRSRQPPRGCIHHSDRGSQYAAADYRKLLAKHGLIGSMSRRGNPYENAMAESFMKTLKVGLSHGIRDFRQGRRVILSSPVQGRTPEFGAFCPLERRTK